MKTALVILSVGCLAFAGEITLAGSTTIQPLAEVLGEAFEADHPGSIVIVSGGGSSVGVKSAAEGTADIGMASREIKPSELTEYPSMVVHTIARDGIAVIVHAGCPVDGLSMDQIKSIFAGEIADWSQVGGTTMPITVVAREEGSGTRAAFEEIVMGESLITDNALLLPSNGAVRTTIATTPGTVGFLSFGYLDSSVKALKVEGASPTTSHVNDGTYPVVRPLNLVTLGQPDGLISQFIEFVFSTEGQAIVAEDYIPVR
jgi:phosphate transport system substrate-binding protein